MANTAKQRPGENMRLIDALGYRLPLAGIVSILHRASGLLMFALLPFIIWMFDTSLTNFERLQRDLSDPTPWTRRAWPWNCDAKNSHS